MSTRTFTLGLLAILLLTAGVRLSNLSGPSLWLDELLTASAANHQTNGTWHAKPLAYTPIAVGLWLQGVDVRSLHDDNFDTWLDQGVTPGVIRLPSALIAVVSVPLLAWLAAGVVGRRAALIFGLLLAISVWHVWISQTARFYPAQMLCYNAALLLWWRGVTARRTGAVVGSGVCLLLAFLTQPTSLMLVGVWGLHWLATKCMREPLRLTRPVWVTLAVTVALCLTQVIGHAMVKTEVYTNFRGGLHPPHVIVFGTLLLVSLPVVAMALASTLALWRSDASRVLYLVLAVLIPPVAFIALYFLKQDVHTRYTAVALVAWLLLASMGLDALMTRARELGSRWLAAAPTLVVLAGMVFMLYQYAGPGYGYRSRWSDAVAYVLKHRQPGDLLAGESEAADMLRYYARTPEVTTVRFKPEGPVHERTAPVWMILRTDTPSGITKRFDWATEHAQLKAVFATRVGQPYSAVNVYLVPPRRDEP